jgi:hypothetical protein
MTASPTASIRPHGPALAFFRVLIPPALCGSTLALALATSGPDTAAFGVFLNAFVLSQIAGVAQVHAVRLPEPYFRLRRFERGGRLYVWLGVRSFKALLTSRIYRAALPTLDFSRRAGGLGTLHERMRCAEAAHAAAFLVVLAAACIAAWQQWWIGATWLMAANVVGNLCPVMLQRYNRGRIDRLRQRFAHKETD